MGNSQHFEWVIHNISQNIEKSVTFKKFV